LSSLDLERSLKAVTIELTTIGNEGRRNRPRPARPNVWNDDA
jgi:hypothetical protein